MYTYHIPRIPQVAVRPHEESHSNDLQYHFNCVNLQKYQVNLISNSCHAIDLLINGQEEAVGENDAQDDPVEPRIDRHNLDDPVPEGIRHR